MGIHRLLTRWRSAGWGGESQIDAQLVRAASLERPGALLRADLVEPGGNPVQRLFCLGERKGRSPWRLPPGMYARRHGRLWLERGS